MSTRFDDDEVEGLACYAMEPLPGGRVLLRLVDGEQIEFARRASAEELIRKEHLHEVSRCELRARHARHGATVDWVALRQPPTGRDSADVVAMKAIARLQEPCRRVNPVGFAWWRRFCACNPPGACLDLLRVMVRVQSSGRDCGPAEGRSTGSSSSGWRSPGARRGSRP